MENDNLDSVKAFEKMLELKEKKDVILRQIAMNARKCLAPPFDFDFDKNISLYNETHEIDRQIEETIRAEIRAELDDSVKEAIKNSGMKDPFSLGMMVQAAIGFFYQSRKKEEFLRAFKEGLNVDYTPILEDEIQKALKKYFK